MIKYLFYVNWAGTLSLEMRRDLEVLAGIVMRNFREMLPPPAMVCLDLHLYVIQEKFLCECVWNAKTPE